MDFDEFKQRLIDKYSPEELIEVLVDNEAITTEDLIEALGDYMDDSMIPYFELDIEE